MEPSKPFQPGISATLGTLGAKTVPLNPLRHGDFRLKRPSQAIILDPLSTCHGHYRRKSRCLICPPGPMDPYEPLQPEITVTWATLEAKNVTLNPP